MSCGESVNDEGYIEEPSADHSAGVPCVICGYDLRGLGEEPRCPECGLRNVPAEYRQHVWDMIDSGEFAFPGPLSMFRKRPTGWWWSLDRKGDVTRSLRYALRNAVIALVITIVSSVLFNAIGIKFTRTRHTPDATGVTQDEQFAQYAWCGFDRVKTFMKRPSVEEVAANSTVSTVSEVCFIPAWIDVGNGLVVFFGWVLMVWAGPAYVGLLTQIRKGMPSYARAPRSVISAAHYESYRLIYVALAFTCLLAGTAILRTPFGVQVHGWHFLAGVSPWILFAGACWVRPLCSDPTKQLVRSELHALRIAFLYAMLLPAVATVIIWMVVQLSMHY